MQVFTNQTTTGLSGTVALQGGYHLASVHSDAYDPRVRFTLLKETSVGSGVFLAVPEWSMNQNGSQVIKGTAGIKVKLHMGLNGGSGSYNAYIDENGGCCSGDGTGAVSYTHLTLPTKA